MCPGTPAQRDITDTEYCTLVFYAGLAELERWRGEIARADAVIVGSYVPEGVGGRAVRAGDGGRRDGLLRHRHPGDAGEARSGAIASISRRRLIPGYDLYLSFTGGPTLDLLERRYGSPAARALYCSVDPALTRRGPAPTRWDLSYLGTYSADRQPTLERLLLDPARALPGHRFAVAGPQYPTGIDWPANVERIEHLPPADHAAFYSASRFTLNVTRADMIAAGWSPSVRLFEAGACGTAIVSDAWEGLDPLFTPGREILLARDGAAVVAALTGGDAGAIGAAARARVLAAHTAAHRAAELETCLDEAAADRANRTTTARAG